MIGLFAWYIYALLALMLVGAGVGSIIRGNTLAGGGYVVGGLLLFGVAVISGRRNKTSGSNVFETNMETLLPVLKALIAEGKNTDAIRRYRVLTGSDLSEAKKLVVAVDARNKFANILNRVAYGKESFVLTRLDEALAAIVQ